MHNNTTGVLVAMLPVTDLAVSAAWYRDLLGMTYVREFEHGGLVTGCLLYDQQAGYGVSLRLRSTTAGQADLRGEHPLIFGVADGDALERLRRHAAGLGYDPTSGEHGDGRWVEVIDPDGIATRFVCPTTRSLRFIGVHVSSGAEYDQPLLALPPVRSSRSPAS